MRALGDATRLEMFRLICAQDGPVCVCDIVDAFDLSQPTISHHLKVLREAGLVRDEKIGVFAFYEPDPAGLEVLESVSSLAQPRAASRARAPAR